LPGALSIDGQRLGRTDPTGIFWRIEPNVGVLTEPTQRPVRAILSEQTRLEKAQ
jgi:hypothetical protein